MGTEVGATGVTYAKNPGGRAATDLLHEIAERKPFQTPRTVDKPLILYGAGKLGRMAKEYLDHIGVSVKYVVDANAAAFRTDPFWLGTDILGPADVSENDKSSSLLAICISTVPYIPIRSALAGQGWSDIVHFYEITEAYRDRHPLGNGWYAGYLSQNDIDSIEYVLARWNDDISRAHHLQFLAWRCLREEWVFAAAPVTTTDRYFISPVLPLLQDQESFLDIGAHFGEVSIRFAEHRQGRFREIIAIEPDPVNRARLHDRFSSTFSRDQFARIMVRDEVLDEQPGTATFFEGLDYASQVSSLGGRKTSLSTLDSLGLHPSFIKLHLEGRERPVLSGGQATLLQCRPIIAATAYHNRFDLWKNFRWMMEFLDDYRFLLRLHGWCGTGLVVYAVPAERSTSTCNI